MGWIRPSTGNSKGNSMPRWAHAAATAWVGPAESGRGSSLTLLEGPDHVLAAGSTTGRACSGSPGQRHVEHRDVVGCGVRPPVRRSQRAHQRLAGGDVWAAREAQQRVEPVGALPGRSRILLLAVRAMVIVGSKSRHNSAPAASRAGSAPATRARARARAWSND